MDFPIHLYPGYWTLGCKTAWNRWHMGMGNPYAGTDLQDAALSCSLVCFDWQFDVGSEILFRYRAHHADDHEPLRKRPVRVLAQMTITAPFYAGVGYSLGAWITQQRLITKLCRLTTSLA
jgi:hypothetical protein